MPSTVYDVPSGTLLQYEPIIPFPKTKKPLGGFFE